MTYAEDYETYSDPEMRVPIGPGRRRKDGLTEVVPVRLRKDDLIEVRRRCKTTGQSVSEFVRESIQRALASTHETESAGSGVDSSSATDYTVSDSLRWTGPSFALVASRPPLELRPLDVIARHRLDMSVELVASVAEELAAFSSDDAFDDSEALFAIREQVDADSFQRRPRLLWRRVRTFASRERVDLELVQRGLVAVVRLAVASAPTKAEIDGVRDDIRSLQERLRAVQQRLRAVTTSDLSDSAWDGFDSFVQTFESVQRALRDTDDDLFQMQQTYKERSQLPIP